MYSCKVINLIIDNQHIVVNLTTGDYFKMYWSYNMELLITTYKY